MINSTKQFIRAPMLLSVTIFIFIIVGIIATCPSRHSMLCSDHFYLVSLYRDIFVDNYDISRWHLTPNPYFFPDMAIFIPLLLISPDPGYAFLIYSLLFYIAILAIVIKISIDCTKKGSSSILFVSLAGLVFITLLQDPGYSFISELFFLPTLHAGSILMGFSILWLFLSVIEKGFTWLSAWIFFMLLFLAINSDIVIIPQFIVPLLITALIFFFFGLVALRPILKTAALAAIAKIIGLVLIKGINFFKIPLVKQDITVANISKCFITFTAYIKDTFGMYQEFWIIFAIWLLFCFLVLFKGRIYFVSRQKNLTLEKKSKFGIIFLSLFSVVSVICTAATPVLTIAWLDRANMRYVLPIFILPLFVTFIIIASFAQRIPWWFKNVVILVVVTFSFFRITQTTRVLDLSDLKLPYPDRVKDLDKFATKCGIRYGYSDYWNAKYLTVMSRKGLRVNQITEDLEIYNWISNPSWFIDNPTGSDGDYPAHSFIITDRLPEDKIIEKFGEPDSRHELHGSQIYVYDGKENIAFRNFVRIPAMMAKGRKLKSSLQNHQALNSYKNEGIPWDYKKNIIIPENGKLSLWFDPPVVNEIMEIAADGDDKYEVLFFKDENLLGSIAVARSRGQGIRTRFLSLPEPVFKKPFDKVIIHPINGDGTYSVGHIFFYDDATKVK